MKIILRNLFPGLILWAAVTTAQAQNYSIPWYKIAGGGTSSSNARYTVSAIIGQADASDYLTGGDYSVAGGFLSFLGTPPATTAPTLSISLSTNSIVLSWSASATGFILERNDNLATPANWSAVSSPPVPINGINYVTNNLTAGNNFYRLRH